MYEVYKHFSRDCASILKQMAKDSKREAAAARNTADESFQLGVLMAYHTVISLLQQQATVFQIPFEELDLADVDPDKHLL